MCSFTFKVLFVADRGSFFRLFLSPTSDLIWATTERTVGLPTETCTRADEPTDDPRPTTGRRLARRQYGASVLWNESSAWPEQLCVLVWNSWLAPASDAGFARLTLRVHSPTCGRFAIVRTCPHLDRSSSARLRMDNCD